MVAGLPLLAALFVVVKIRISYHLIIVFVNQIFSCWLVPIDFSLFQVPFLIVHSFPLILLFHFHHRHPHHHLHYVLYCYLQR